MNELKAYRCLVALAIICGSIWLTLLRATFYLENQPHLRVWFWAAMIAGGIAAAGTYLFAATAWDLKRRPKPHRFGGRP